MSKKFLNLSTFQCWKTNFKNEVCICSNFLAEALLWIKEVEMVESVDDLETSQSIGGHRFPNFEMLGWRTDCVHDLRMFSGDWGTSSCFSYYRSIQYPYKATVSKILIPDGIKYLLSTSEVPNDKILESVYKKRIRESDQLQTVLAMYEEKIKEIKINQSRVFRS